MEQVAICLLGFHLEFLPIFKVPGLMEQLYNHISIRVSFRVHTSYEIPRPHGTIRHISIRVSLRVYITPKK